MRTANEQYSNKQRTSLQEENPDEAMSFRRAMQVREIMVFGNKTVFPVCPRCQLTLEREYMAYCDRCGQCLDWKKLRSAAVIFPKTGGFR